MPSPSEQREALEAAYQEAAATGVETECAIAVSYNAYTKFLPLHDDAIIRFNKFPGGVTSRGKVSGSRLGQVRIRVPRIED